MVFGEINAFFSILEKIKKRFSSSDTEKNEKQENIASRFIRLFESHGVHRNQIPRFESFGISVADVQNDQSLLKKLNEDLLSYVCEKFSVRREWLDGASNQIYHSHDFYKKPEQFSEFLDGLIENNPERNISGFLLTSGEKKDNTVLLFEEEIGRIEAKAIHRYYLCDATTFHYWKSRAFITACVACAWRKKVFIQGRYLSQRKIDEIAGGEYLLGWAGDGPWSLKGRRWYPEDMTINPDSYLKGIDPEINNYGRKAALALWLELEQEGYMDSGLKNNVRDLFANKLSDFR